MPAAATPAPARDVVMTAATAARTPMLTKIPKSTCLALTPERTAACRLPPIAYTCRPKPLRLSTNEQAMISAPTMSRTMGVPPALRASQYVTTPMSAAATTTLTTKAESGSTERPCLRSDVRERHWETANAAMPRAPMPSVTTSRSPTNPNQFGTDPLLIALNPSGRPATVVPTSTIASPRKTSMPASVTMKAGMPTYATQNPCQTPTSAPTTSESSTATSQGSSHWVSMIAQRPPTNATTDPTDRSMCPATITMTMPIASTMTYAFCWMRLATLFGYSRRPSVSTWKSRTMTSRAATMPYWRTLRPRYSLTAFIG